MRFTCGRGGGHRTQKHPAQPGSAGMLTENAPWKQCFVTAEVRCDHRVRINRINLSQKCVVLIVEDIVLFCFDLHSD